jgi:hypothetical protein
MKAKLIFYGIAVVALVLILAAAPSHATERRDPVLIQESGSAHGTNTSAHPGKQSPHGKKPAHAVKQSHPQGVDPLFEAKDSAAPKKDAGNGKSGGK